LVALTYVEADGSPASYPANPNGSVDGIAGLCNAAGNVFGLMPHPENHVFPWQHPRHETAMDGLRLFRNGIRFA
jgi:phosphoribosylformylglycinamidine synthase